jgi:undecaprenyl-diphosphatase
VLVWLVFLAVGVVAASVAAVVTIVVGRHRARVHHGLVHGAAAAVRDEVHRHPPLRRFLRDRVRIAEATGLVLTASLLALVAIGVLAFQVRSDSAVVRVDRSVAIWAAEHAGAASTDFLRWFTDLGSSVAVVVIMVLVVVVTARRTAWRPVALFVLVTVGGSWLATNLLKLTVERSRPGFGPLPEPASFSYPSGHSSGAAVCFATAALCLGRGRSHGTRAALAATAAALACMVAASRVLLGVHWLSDVTAGLMLGSAWFTLCAVAFGGRLLRFGAPVEMAARVEVLDRVPGEAGPDRQARDPERGADDGVGDVVHAEQHPGQRDRHHDGDRHDRDETA